MTSSDRFERSLPDLLEALAAPRRPDYAEDLFTRTAATRQRPRWSFPERWLPMSVTSRRLAGTPRIPWRLAVVAALLVLAAGIAALVAGTLLNRQPAPYGLAANGRIAFVDSAGRVLVGDPTTGSTSTLVSEGSNTDPIFAQDGGRIAFLRTINSASTDVYVVNTDGKGLLKVTTAPISTPSFMGWSADGRQLLMVDGDQRMLLFDALTPGEPFNLSAAIHVRGAEVGLGYNFRSTAAFRPPAAAEILFKSVVDEKLMAVRPDGTGLRTLVDQRSGIAYAHLKGAEWSPDGSKVLVLLEFAGSGGTLFGNNTEEPWHAYIVNADGTDLHPLSSLSTDPSGDQNSPLWSPDGSRVAFQYWIRHTADDGEDFKPIAIVDVATGKMHDVGPTVDGGYVSWEWSPDGTSILAVPGDNSGHVLIVDAITGGSKTAPWSVAQPISWQRSVR